MIQKALFGAGCFWGVEEYFRTINGVTKTEVGYSGGHTKNPTYESICYENTDHAEVLLVEFDENLISYELLVDEFWKCHDPTTLDRQGNDIGDSYRSEIFALSTEQEVDALEIISEINESGRWPGRVVTKVSKATEFWEAEPEHQNYLQRYPRGYTCHFPRDNWKLSKS